MTTTPSELVALGSFAYELITDKPGYPLEKNIVSETVELVANSSVVSEIGIGYVNMDNHYIYVNTKNAGIYDVYVRITYTE